MAMVSEGDGALSPSPHPVASETVQSRAQKGRGGGQEAWRTQFRRTNLTFNIPMLPFGSPLPASSPLSRRPGTHLPFS